MRKRPIVCRPKTIEDCAGDLAEQRQLREQELAERARRRAERDEHQREAEDEGERREDDLRARRGAARRAAAHLVERHAGDERDVARDQRQHARRDERQEARGERGKQRDVLIHAACRRSVDFLQRNHVQASTPASGRTCELHRRQVLEHEVPLPPLGRVRRLQPVLRRTGRANATSASPAYAALPDSASASVGADVRAAA